MRSLVRVLSAGVVVIPWAEVAHGLCIVGGWALVTWGVAELTVWQAWPLSAGLLLLSFAGWAHLKVLFANGFYALTRKSGGGR